MIEYTIFAASAVRKEMEYVFLTTSWVVPNWKFHELNGYLINYLTTEWVK